MDAVVILNWNKADLTRHCLEVAQRSTQQPLQWIVVDNGSREPITGLGDDVVVIRNPENLGFAGGVNTGIRYAFAKGADYVWLLNNDAEALPDALDALLAAARADPAIGLASAVILNSDQNDKIDWYCGRWTNATYQVTTDPAEGERWMQETQANICLVGTAMLVSRQLVERIGLFDEALFAYWEDNDISRRSAAAGFRNVVVPQARVRHQGGDVLHQPSERPPYYFYYMVRNELLLMRKMGEILMPRQVYWALRRSWMLHARLASLTAQRRALRRGVLHGLLGFGGAYQE